ncbi:hypothetical protein I5F74_33385, partial [Pseudomonas aeruginosa]|nr:hypothetical protein [Pseudomonas aeruginosa]
MSEMPAREQMISAYSELVGLDPVRRGAGGAAGRPPRGPPPPPPRGRGPRGARGG